jgi:hypothetical protein
MQHSRVREIFDKENDTILEISNVVGGKKKVIEVNIQNIYKFIIYGVLNRFQK